MIETGAFTPEGLETEEILAETGDVIVTIVGIDSEFLDPEAENLAVRAEMFEAGQAIENITETRPAFAPEQIPAAPDQIPPPPPVNLIDYAEQQLPLPTEPQNLALIVPPRAPGESLAGLEPTTPNRPASAIGEIATHFEALVQGLAA